MRPGAMRQDCKTDGPVVPCPGTMETTVAGDGNGTRAASTFTTVLRVGPVLLLVAGCVTGLLGVHSTTDAWIALATGRHIVETGKVPTTDPFSYTFYGKDFYNQNWLSHLTYYWLHEHVGPAAVPACAWLLTLAIFGLVFCAVRIRTRSWLAAILATGAMAALSRHYFDVRPHTFGYACLAATCAILHFLSVRRQRQPWWPALLLLPILFYWGNVHGSFIFGYGLLGLFVGCWIIDRRWSSLGIPATARQIMAVCAATVTAFVLTVAVGPYGIRNFIHVKKIGGSEAFREVVEWRHPWVKTGAGLDVWPFWVALGLALVALLVALAFWLSARSLDRSQSQPRRDGPRLTAFDALLVVIGLAMALWARRFAPLFYVLATPPIVTTIVRLAMPASARVRRGSRLALGTLAWVAAILCGAQAAAWGHFQLAAQFAGHPELNLLQRLTGYQQNPLGAIRFLRQIDVDDIRVLSEWTVAGVIMYEIPQARVYMDGRAQQVYDEHIYRRFTGLFGGSRSDPASILNILNKHPTDAVVLRSVTGLTRNLFNTLRTNPAWALLRFNAPAEPGGILFLRRNSEVFTRLLEMERTGQLHWPSNAAATFTRGNIWRMMDPPDDRRAIEYYKAAVEQEPTIGLLAYPALLRAWKQMGRLGEAYGYLAQQRQRIADPRFPLDPTRRGQLRKLLDSYLSQFEAVPLNP